MKNIFNKFYQDYIEKSNQGNELSVNQNYQFCIVNISKEFYSESVISEVIDKFKENFIVDFVSGGYLGFYSKEISSELFFRKILDKRMKFLIFSHRTFCVNQGNESYMHFGPLYYIEPDLIKEFINLNYGEQIYKIVIDNKNV